MWCILTLVASLGSLAAASPAASCPVQVSSQVKGPVVAKGYSVRRITSGLSDPRGIIFDSAGHLLVVESGVGVSSLTLADHGGDCVGVSGKTAVVQDDSLNHGLQLSLDGSTLYASNTETVYSYPYSASNAQASTNQRVSVVSNMTNGDHTTRTLLIPKGYPNTLLVARGSGDNIDPIALDINSGHSQIRSFQIPLKSGNDAYNYPSDGKLMGWGLRNDVGMAVHPSTSGLYSVENSVDQMMRDGKDIHETNPGEKLNFLGYVDPSKSSPNTGANFGYPKCFGAWNIATIPNNKGITIGSNFAIGKSSPAKDQSCRNDHAAPRLVFRAHMAPLDIKFNSAGSTAWITFHGSWDRDVAAGYKVCTVDWDAQKGEPSMPSHTKGACKSVVTNIDAGKCANNPTCFRPVGMAIDSKGRLYFTSDATGEIYVVTKSDGSGVA